MHPLCAVSALENKPGCYQSQESGFLLSRPTTARPRHRCHSCPTVVGKLQKKKKKNIDRLINWKKKTTKINMNEGVNTILGLWSVPLNCSFTWQCSLGISVTGIVISHHIIGMTLLSCCWVTSRFRLSKHTLYKVFFYLKYYHFIIIFLNPAGTRLHKHTKCLIFL